jgi:cation diffusion facilitator family transporter
MASHRDSNSQVAVRRIAKRALLGGMAIMLIKFAIFKITNSVAVLADGVDSIVNLIAAIVMLYGIWLVNDKKYSQFDAKHARESKANKAEHLAIGFESWLILIIGLVVGYISIERLTQSTEPAAQVENIEIGIWLLGGVTLLTTSLAIYTWLAGKKHDCIALKADAMHMAADVASTIGVMISLAIVKSTEQNWLDPVAALLITAIVLWTSWRLMWKSVLGLSDDIEREIDPTINRILTNHIREKNIKQYDQTRYRFNGPNRWIEFRLLVEPSMTIAQGRALAADIEQLVKKEIENATVHAIIEPYEPPRSESGELLITTIDVPVPSTTENEESESEDEHQVNEETNDTDKVTNANEDTSMRNDALNELDNASESPTSPDDTD